MDIIRSCTCRGSRSNAVAISGNKGYALLHGSSNLEKKLLAREETSTIGELYVKTYIGTSRVTQA